MLLQDKGGHLALCSMSFYSQGQLAMEKLIMSPLR
jgi:hypothetical protein